jgi:hypothetical protein
MTLKRIHAPHLGRDVVFGRKRSPHAPHMRLRDYMAKLPTYPGSADFTAKGAPSLSQMFGNDALGDCVIAGANHIFGVETGNAGNCVVTPEAQIVKEYSAIGGYVPGDPSTDQGCDLVTALNYYVKSGQLLAWLAVDGANFAEVQAALWLFENLYFGMELPDAWVNPMPSGPGFTWGVAGPQDGNNGHCVPGAAYDSTGVTIDTWAMLGKITPEAIAEYATAKNGGELFVMLSPLQLPKGQAKAPNGVAWSDILADFNAMGGTVAVPSPAPSPSPTPAPAGTVVTLSLTQGWTAAGINAAPDELMTKEQAITAANVAGLAANWPVSP